MLRSLAILVGIVWAVLAAPSAAQADRRVALVIGNSSYSNSSPLRNPKNDANDLAATLKQVGFEVTLGLDLDQRGFGMMIEKFARELEGADVGLLFYAGHALQINEKNYLVSINARLENEFLIASEAIELEPIVRLMELKTQTNLIFLDACRNNPLADNLRRNLAAMKRSANLGRGLARMEPSARDTLIAFAAAPGQEAADGARQEQPVHRRPAASHPPAGCRSLGHAEGGGRGCPARDAQRAASAAAERHVAHVLFCRHAGRGRQGRREASGAGRHAGSGPRAGRRILEFRAGLERL